MNVSISFYHPKGREHFAQIFKRGEEAGGHVRQAHAFSRDYASARALVPIRALLAHAGYPALTNGFCPFHGGDGGRALSVFRHFAGHDMFKCHACDVYGDVVELWHALVLRSGFAPASWDRPSACGDLLARVSTGLINTDAASFARTSSSSTHETPCSLSQPAPALNSTSRKRAALLGASEESCARERGSAHQSSERLPADAPKHVSIARVLRSLFPRPDGFLMLTAKLNYHPVKRRDEWLSRTQALLEMSYVSQNFLARGDLDGACNLAFKNSPRRWLVIEGDHGSLEEQFWIISQLARVQPLGVCCWSGNNRCTRGRRSLEARAL